MTLPRPYKRGEVRPDYWRGVWDYARGKPAEKHRRYAEAVKLAKTGEHPFAPWWIRTWQDVEAVLAGCWFEHDAGARVCRFFDDYLHHGMAGINDEFAGRLFTLLDWQRWDLIMPLFGWMRPGGTRRFREALVWIPKKNGKSALCSGLGLYFLTKDSEPTPHVFSAAFSREQAGIIHDAAVQMIAMSSVLRAMLKPIHHTKTITCAENFGQFKALAFEAGVKVGVQQGRNWNALLFDEVHAQVNAAYFNALKYGGIARRQPMLIEISTAGIYDVTAVGWTEFERMLKIHEGHVKNTEVFTYYALAKRTDDYRDPKVHKTANPSIDVTIKAEDLTAHARSAHDNPHDLNEFLRYRLNRWVHTRDRLVKPDDWAACACMTPQGESGGVKKRKSSQKPKVTYPEAFEAFYLAYPRYRAREDFRESLKGRECYGGMDLSLSQDITAFALLFSELADAPAACLTWFWLPKDTIFEAERKNNVPYREWADAGFMKLTPGNVVDYQVVEDDIEEIMKSYKVKSIGFDPKFANQITSHMIAKHGEDFAFIVAQSALNMGPPTKFVMELIIRHALIHEDNPILNWHVSNAQAYSRAGNVIVMKDERGKRFKVDGLIAIIIAAQRAMCAPPPKPASMYETEGVLVV